MHLSDILLQIRFLAGLECSGNTDGAKSEDPSMSAEELRRQKRRRINRESARRMRLKPRLEVQEQKTMMSSSTCLYPILVCVEADTQRRAINFFCLLLFW